MISIEGNYPQGLKDLTSLQQNFLYNEAFVQNKSPLCSLFCKMGFLSLPFRHSKSKQ